MQLYSPFCCAPFSFHTLDIWKSLHLDKNACAEKAERRAKEEIKKEEEVKKEALFSSAETRRSNIMGELNAQ